MCQTGLPSQITFFRRLASGEERRSRDEKKPFSPAVAHEGEEVI
jgi:hypothetical protein